MKVVPSDELTAEFFIDAGTPSDVDDLGQSKGPVEMAEEQL